MSIVRTRGTIAETNKTFGGLPSDPLGDGTALRVFLFLRSQSGVPVKEPTANPVAAGPYADLAHLIAWALEHGTHCQPAEDPAAEDKQYRPRCEVKRRAFVRERSGFTFRPSLFLRLLGTCLPWFVLCFPFKFPLPIE